MKKLKILISIVTVFIMLFSYAGVVKATDDDVNEVEDKTLEYDDSFIKLGTVVNSGENGGSSIQLGAGTNTVEYDGYRKQSPYITLPYIFSWNADGSSKDTNKIEISSSYKSTIGNYKLYYQVVFNPDKSKFDNLNNYKTSSEYLAFKSALESLKEVYDTKRSEYMQLSNESSSLYSQYNALSAEEKTSESGLALKARVEAKQAEVNAKEEEMQTANDNYNSKYDEYDEYFERLVKTNTPAYDDTKWVSATDGDHINATKVPTSYGFVVWGKIQYTNTEGQSVTEYKSGFYSSNWNNDTPEDTKVSNVIVVNDINGDMSPADKTPSDNSTADKPIPQTGEHTSVVMIALISLLGIGYVSYRRFRNTQVK